LQLALFFLWTRFIYRDKVTKTYYQKQHLTGRRWQQQQQQHGAVYDTNVYDGITRLMHVGDNAVRQDQQNEVVSTRSTSVRCHSSQTNVKTTAPYTMSLMVLTTILNFCLTDQFSVSARPHS